MNIFVFLNKVCVESGFIYVFKLLKICANTTIYAIFISFTIMI